MRNVHTSRDLIIRALLAGLLTGSSGGVFAQHHAVPIVCRSPPFSRAAATSNPAARGQQQRPAPIERRWPPATEPSNGAVGTHVASPDMARANGPEGEHLAEWMNQHRGLTLQQQQQALEREPGFRELPEPTQQRMRERLAQLNAMSPQERQRILAHTEVMERLSPEQRSQVRGAMQQLGSLPPGQRQEVARSFRQLRSLPPDQRMAAMNSDRCRSLNDAQRTTLSNLLRVEPMLPPPEPRQPR
jgi:hypothetical protein